ncbi:hypothetical protein FEM48_Zijuj07G0024500 [Ziziphus jujuba var. spinosa]|uniref:Histone deacetylase interacting domain-containing protein n=1 Tax=Ziziphus jujuba var. spinosa TaxID=714518 RepID=A0A978V1X4_ZIZJJ|nr:hypothetical protein FEM48_Zijuj07G0024500 [Ziziphus jujuba var. spinosa]
MSNGCPLVTVASKKSEETSVLNGCLVSENSTGSSDYTKPTKRNKDEEATLNIFEEKRFELDMVFNPLRSAIENAEKLQNLITALALETPIDLDKYFTVLDLKYIQSVYGNQHKDMRDILKPVKSIRMSSSANIYKLFILLRIEAFLNRLKGLH